MKRILPSTQVIATDTAPIRAGKKQAGVSLMDFIMYLILAVFVFLGIVKLYNLGVAWKSQANTVSAVTQIKAAAEKVKSINHTGVSMSKLCDVKRNALSSMICGSNNGEGTNEYGGNYSVAATTGNAQRITVSITNVDTQYIDDLADTLAKVSAGNCNSATGCSTVSVTDSTITVTM
ncbi:hypothetical protein BS333_21470 (plasmid) [Vibrio azureus]|uniref:Type 4 secretion system PilS N-terminal domain-containing protein n=1 Tax=Vibrio azureus NBRC 104587 TaxID=1219077 RepID=U3CD01_9VIBR|nr:hypothetical protein [Vibrio azureus]AUI88953.1 hypothetical protein BS333_21470 [Vibrio azureus]GAD76218.1 hypothetical protein VAZ01S_039_00430 [Vibrio azureus NBRC 104587]